MLNMNGFIDFIDYNNKLIKGWVVDLDNSKNKLEIELYINKKLISKTKANVFREDLYQSKIGDGYHGFIFENIDLEGVLDLDIKVSGTNKILKRPINGTTLLLARQRSGTNVLRKCLNTHKDIFAINEIFDIGIFNDKNFEVYQNISSIIASQKLDLIGSFYPYYNQLMNQYQKPFSYKETFEKYMNMINTISNTKYQVIDIKYNHIHSIVNNINPLIKYEPLLFNIIKINKWKVLNLTRTNYIKSFVSGELAAKTGKYVVSKNEKFDVDVKLTVDIDKMIKAIEVMKKEDEYIHNYFKNYNHYLKIDYSEMFDENGDFDQFFLEKISNFFNIDKHLFNRKPLLKKLQKKPLEELVQNYSELYNKVKNTEYEKYLYKE